MGGNGSLGLGLSRARGLNGTVRGTMALFLRWWPYDYDFCRLLSIAAERHASM